jgi:hypothetical protein
MREIIKLKTNGNIEAHHVVASHGWIGVKKPDSHDRFTAAGIVTSPGNSERIYLNGYNDKYYIFNGWEADQFGRMKDKPAYIEMIDVTDLLTYQPLTAYRVTYHDGSTTSTSMAAGVTLDDARAYFIGQWFNFGDVDGPDVMKQAVSVESI